MTAQTQQHPPIQHAPMASSRRFTFSRRFVRVVLLAVAPVVAALVGLYFYATGGRFVSTQLHGAAVLAQQLSGMGDEAQHRSHAQRLAPLSDQVRADAPGRGYVRPADDGRARSRDWTFSPLISPTALP